MGLFSGTSAPHPELLARLARLERKVDAILAALNVPLDEDGMEEVRALAAAGKKIEAIKLYREQTGAGLAEARDAVERGV